MIFDTFEYDHHFDSCDREHVSHKLIFDDNIFAAVCSLYTIKIHLTETRNLFSIHENETARKCVRSSSLKGGKNENRNICAIKLEKTFNNEKSALRPSVSVRNCIRLYINGQFHVRKLKSSNYLFKTKKLKCRAVSVMMNGYELSMNFLLV